MPCAYTQICRPLLHLATAYNNILLFSFERYCTRTTDRNKGRAVKGSRQDFTSKGQKLCILIYISHLINSMTISKFTIMRRAYKCGTKARLSFSCGSHAPVIMMEEVNVGGKKPQEMARYISYAEFSQTL